MKKILEEILDKAAYAPSGDNSQPWWFTIGENNIDVHLVPGRDNPILNFRLSGSYFAHGALIRNIEILASAHQFRTETTLLPDPEDSNFVARIHFYKDATIRKDPLTLAITDRCTNRKPYASKPIPRDFITEIRNIGERIQSGKLLLIEDKAKIVSVANSLVVMERTALETKAVHQLFFDTIVWTKEEEAAKEKGLHIKTLELPTPIQGLFRIIRHWNIANALNHIGLSRLAAKGNAKAYATAPLMGVIAMQGSSTEDYIRAGMAFQEIWLTATARGVALHPVAGLLYLTQRILSNEECPWSEKHSLRIIDAYKNIQTNFETGNTTLAMLFRAGYAEEPTARAGKRPPVIK